MNDGPAQGIPARFAMFVPLRDGAFRRIWTSSLLSNLGQMILGTAAAWEMTRITGSPGMVALVQTALMLPIMLIAVPAGAIADMFDRRKVAITGLCFACACASTLTVVAASGATSPWLLLAFCTLIGIGVALFNPAWQASVREQVSAEHLPAAVALTSISYNVARSFGPAVGGGIVLAFGSLAAFAATAVCYLPLVASLILWRKPSAPSRLPPERFHRAVLSGALYVRYSPAIRNVVLRTFVTGLCGASVAALTPIVVRDLLHGGAGVFGVMLGIYGIGAVCGSLLIGWARQRTTAEHATRLCALATGASIVLIGLSRNAALTGVAMFMSGSAWMLLLSMLNLGVQLSVPRWVTARALSWYLSFLTGGLAIGAWIWGHVTAVHGVGPTMLMSGGALMLTPLVGFLLPMPRVRIEDNDTIAVEGEPAVALDLTERSGPVVVEIDYRVDPLQARQFYLTMLGIRGARLRNGAYGWSIMRDMTDPCAWTERCQFPTWGDYLRRRARLTQADKALQALGDGFCIAGSQPHVRHRLERPFGSVRWRSDTPDPADSDAWTQPPP